MIEMFTDFTRPHGCPSQNKAGVVLHRSEIQVG